MSDHIVFEYSLDGGMVWHHARTDPRWVLDSAALMAELRRHIRGRARELHGNVERITIHWLDEDDERAVNNQPPSNGDAETERLVQRFKDALERLRNDPAERARIDSLIEEIERIAAA